MDLEQKFGKLGFLNKIKEFNNACNFKKSGERTFCETLKNLTIENPGREFYVVVRRRRTEVRESHATLPLILV